MPRQRWTREQDLAVLFLKVEYHGQLAPGPPGDLVQSAVGSLGVISFRV